MLKKSCLQLILGLVLGSCFLIACSDPVGLKNIPTEFYIDTNSAIEASLDDETLKAFIDINKTMATGAEIGPETRQLIRELNNTLQNGARVGLDSNSLGTIDRLTETIGRGLNLNISIDPVVVVVEVEPETRNWFTELLDTHAPDLAARLREEVQIGTTQISDEVKEDVITILQEAQKNFDEVVRLVGVEGRCNVDFLSGRVDNRINQAVDTFIARIAASQIMSVLGTENASSPPALSEAVICQVEPAPLELVDNGGNLIPKEQHLDIVGYDFLEGNLPDVQIHTTDGSEFATLKVSRVSNYQMQVNLQTVNFSNVGFGAEIALNWPGGEQNSIIVLQPAPTSVPTPVPELTATPTVEPCPVALIDGPNGYLNIRSGPGTVYSEIGQLQNGPSPCVTGKALSVTGDTDAVTGQIIIWWEIDFGGQKGWISGRYASVECPETKCPIKLPPPTPVAPPPPPTSVPPPPPPTAEFQCGPMEGRVPLTVNCIDLSANNPTRWLWEFGDGSISNNQNHIHIYNSAGQFTVKLTVTNDQGSSTNEAIINVTPPPAPELPAPEPPPPPIRWVFEITKNAGGSPHAQVEVSSDPLPGDYVIVGIGGRVHDSNFTTLHVKVAPINNDGTLGVSRTLKYGTEPDQGLEAEVTAPPQHVVIGVGFEVYDSNLRSIWIYTRLLDPITGVLVRDIYVNKGGPEPNVQPEAVYYEQGDTLIVVRIGTRVHDNNVTTLVLDYGKIGRH